MPDPSPHHLRPHRRRNPLTGSHVLVSPHRAARPWLGQEDAPAPRAMIAHDPECYLCPGNARVGGHQNPDYVGPFVFDNDFAALFADAPPAPDASAEPHPLFTRSDVRGTCRVICFSPDHSATLPDLSPAAMRAVIDTWCDQTGALGQSHAWVQLFENKGAMMGCSNPHPHGQVWATDSLPDEAQREDDNQRAYFRAHGRAMLADVAAQEADRNERIVAINERWIAIVPYWASWPFETLLLPRFAAPRLTDVVGSDRDALGDVLQRLTRGYDALFGISFPYSMGWHGAPFDGNDPAPWQVHAHFYPPLLRSASVRKFMVGYEMMAEAQRDL
ncbi:MAG: UDP-glucose--hexose-1-phosphate uridylyltransferase, partial [Sphingopyxis sp.]|nr:UDP-glucose--hexose-1-phosphate uridylyltransferase [Sphingopyxis sp.]